MSSRRSDELNHSLARTLAALVGSVPVALAVGIALALALPFGPNLRLTIGSYAVLPAWLTAACCTFLASNARRAWLLLMTALLLSAFTALLAVEFGPGIPTTWAN